MPVLEALEATAVDVQSEARKRALIEEIFDEIQAEAYFHWQERGSPHGSAWIDWFTAQEELLAAAQTPPLR